MPDDKPHADAVQRLLQVMRRLRDPERGCPWDLEQDFRSIAPYTVEEAHEVADAIERGDLGELKDELGDLLFQVVFHARLGEELGEFDFDAIAGAVADKLIRRHPHVFGGAGEVNAAGQTEAWERIKAAERRAAGLSSAVDGVWPSLAPVLAKIGEELGELEAELAGGDRERLEDELGDVLFAVANLARKLDIDADQALRGSNYKFETRFRAMEARALRQGREFSDLTLDEQEALWCEVKRAAVDPGDAT